MNTRLVLIALLVSASGAYAADGSYQRTKDNKAIVWNPDPRHEDAATWSGDRDGRYANGYGTLTWYRVERKFGLGSRLPVESYIPVVRYSGKMVRGKLNGLVVAVDNEGKKSHATFADGNIKGEWADGATPTAEPVAKQTPADQKPAEAVQQGRVAEAPATEPSPAASPTPERPPARSSSESVREQSGATSPPGFGAPSPASQPVVDQSSTDLPSQKSSSSLASSTATPRPDPPVNERTPKRTTTALPEHFSAEPTPIPQQRPSRGPDATSPAKEHVAKNTTMALPAENFSPEPTPIPQLTANRRVAQHSPSLSSAGRGPAMKLQVDSLPPIPEHPPSPGSGVTGPPPSSATGSPLPSDSESVRERSAATAPSVEVPAGEPLATASPSASASPVPDRPAEQRVASYTPPRGRAQADELLQSLVIPPSAMRGVMNLRTTGSVQGSIPSTSSASPSPSSEPPSPSSVRPSTSSVRPSTSSVRPSTLPVSPSSSSAPPSTSSELPSTSSTLPSTSSAPAAPSALPQLSTAEVIGLADVAARKQGRDPAGYQCAKVDYTVADDKWSVWYDKKPAADGMIDVGKRFAVTVEDKTKKTSVAGR